MKTERDNYVRQPWLGQPERFLHVFQGRRPPLQLPATDSFQVCELELEDAACGCMVITLVALQWLVRIICSCVRPNIEYMRSSLRLPT